MKRLTMSETCARAYPWMQFGYCYVQGLRVRDQAALPDAQRQVEASLRQDSEEIVRRAKAISRFYKQQNETNRSHIESLVKAVANGKTIKPVHFIVDAVVVTELKHALPLGVHDTDKLEGNLVLDVAAPGETFDGIGARSVVTREGEIVLRDDIGIWASYTQGPDARTLVDQATRNVVLLGFFTPETTREYMQQGLSDAVNLLLSVASGHAGDIRFVGSGNP